MGARTIKEWKKIYCPGCKGRGLIDCVITCGDRVGKNQTINCHRCVGKGRVHVIIYQKGIYK